MPLLLVTQRQLAKPKNGPDASPTYADMECGFCELELHVVFLKNKSKTMV
jgi:hypothetical protein